MGKGSWGKGRVAWSRPGRVSVWKREEAKNRRSGEQMAEEGMIALGLESDCLVLSLTCYVTLCCWSFTSHHKMGIT